LPQDARFDHMLAGYYNEIITIAHGDMSALPEDKKALFL